jgi:hypothetical protein
VSLNFFILKGSYGTFHLEDFFIRIVARDFD